MVVGIGLFARPFLPRLNSLPASDDIERGQRTIAIVESYFVEFRQPNLCV